MKNTQLSKNWNLYEFRCTGKNCCGGAAPVQERLIVFLQALRDKLGVPLYCVREGYGAGSGFRCIVHNAEVKGVKNSFHTRGMAVDIWSDVISSLEIYTAALELIEELGFGFAIHYSDKHFVHIDIGER